MSKRLIQGRDFHGWAWETKDGQIFGPCWWEQPKNTEPQQGQWVRVKFVVVEPKPKKKVKVRK